MSGFKIVSEALMNINSSDDGVRPYVVDINEKTLENDNYRNTLWTGKHLQLTVMSILPNDDVGLEVHEHLDQFIRIERGEGLVLMGNTKDNLSFKQSVRDDFAIIIPAGKWHNIINKSSKPMKLYAIYSPTEHPKGTIHKTKQDAIDDE